MSTSAEPERVFSNLSHLLQNSQRSNLHQTSLEDLMTIRNQMAVEKAERNFKLPITELDDVYVLDSEDEQEDCLTTVAFFC